MARRLLASLGLLLAVAAVGALVYVRAAPSGPRWHVDPAVDGRSGPGRWLLADGGDAPALRLPVPPGEALATFDAVALAQGAERLVWTPEEGRATYVVRSRVLGFPDYVSVSVAPEGTDARLSAYSRLRFGRDDLGVNRARLEDWTGPLAPDAGGLTPSSRRDETQPAPVSRQIGTLSAISQSPVNARPSTTRQRVSPISARSP